MNPSQKSLFIVIKSINTVRTMLRGQIQNTFSSKHFHFETSSVENTTVVPKYLLFYSTSEINTSSLRTVPNLSPYNIKKI